MVTRGTRILDPLERFSEIVFGLIMVLSFTCAISVLVFLSTLPVIVPFIFVHEARLALRISNGIAIAMLFATGPMLAGYAGMRRVPTGLAMVAIGAVLVGLTIALGG